MGKVAKLDTYDYIVLPGVIRIHIDSSTDPILVDILSEIENSQGLIYVEGFYYLYLEDYDIASDEKFHWLELSVVGVDNSITMGDDIGV